MKIVFFFFLKQNICCGCSEELSQREGSIEYPKLMFELTDKIIMTIVLLKHLLNWTNGLFIRLNTV